MATTTTRLTIEDFERLPDEMAEGHELVDGELIDVSGNTPNHNSIRDLLIALLLLFVRERRLGTVIGEQEYDFNGNAHGPDVSFFGVEKQPLLQRDKRVQKFVPDLAIEIASASDTFNSLLRKKERYRSCGTREVWIISLETREVLVYSDRGDRILRADAELASELIPGFQILVKLLFETMG
ncbi:MAG: Uma2 family endonuclease [Acidobacteriia bacterium]|nr:Uma2 family endonuclease [Terriglobia bacterium]